MGQRNWVYVRFSDNHSDSWGCGCCSVCGAAEAIQRSFIARYDRCRSNLAGIWRSNRTGRWMVGSENLLEVPPRRPRSYDSRVHFLDNRGSMDNSCSNGKDAARSDVTLGVLWYMGHNCRRLNSVGDAAQRCGGLEGAGFHCDRCKLGKLGSINPLHPKVWNYRSLSWFDHLANRDHSSGLFLPDPKSLPESSSEPVHEDRGRQRVRQHSVMKLSDTLCEDFVDNAYLKE